jgi:membrane protein YdbS with pleckstrin-like domain
MSDPRKDNKDDKDAPKFGRLLLVLAFALVLIVAITIGSEAYFS